MQKIHLPAAVINRANAAAIRLGLAPGQLPALTPVPAPTMTRATFHAQRHGGGWRKARKSFLCQQGCLRHVAAGDTYFDTCEVTAWPLTRRICAACAERKI